MTRRPHVAVVVRTPADSETGYIPAITAHVRVAWPPNVPFADIEATVQEAARKAVAEARDRFAGSGP